MKYMTNGGFGSNPLMRITLLATLFLLAALWTTNAALYLTRMGLDPASVVAHYRGSEEVFIQARTFGSMLEVTHAHLATMTVVVLLVTHLAIFLPWSMKAKVPVILVPFAGLLLGEASSWLVRFVSPSFAWLKIGSFLAFQISLAVLLVALARLLWSGRAAARVASDARSEREGEGRIAGRRTR